MVIDLKRQVSMRRDINGNGLDQRSEGRDIRGGMRGVACAVGLVRAGPSVEIFEAAVCSGKYYLQIKHLLECNQNSKSNFNTTGSNAIRVLKALGVMNAVQARSNQPKPTLQPFHFISGMPGHEDVYDANQTFSTFRSIHAMHPPLESFAN